MRFSIAEVDKSIAQNYSILIKSDNSRPKVIDEA
jgi:hypothetical protein